MLILTRRFSESLMIGDDVKVTILGAKGNSVRIGIKAPNDIPVHREEVYNRIHGNKAELNTKPLAENKRRVIEGQDI